MKILIDTAEIMGKINAFLIVNGLLIEYQDVAIAATFVREKGNWLLTRNKKHFTIIPACMKQGRQVSIRVNISHTLISCAYRIEFINSPVTKGEIYPI